MSFYAETHVIYSMNACYLPRVVPLQWKSTLKWCRLEAFSEKLTRSQRKQLKKPSDNYLSQRGQHYVPRYLCSPVRMYPDAPSAKHLNYYKGV